MNNPFEIIDARLRNIEGLLLDIKNPEASAAPAYSQDEYLTRDEASQILRCSTRTLRNQEKEGKIKAKRIGRKVLYKRTDILKLIDGSRTLVS